jgi:hypothetical protein
VRRLTILLAAPGTEFVEWVAEGSCGAIGCGTEAALCLPFVLEGEGDIFVTAVFASTGPTNRVPLTVTKEAGGPGPVKRSSGPVAKAT